MSLESGLVIQVTNDAGVHQSSGRKTGEKERSFLECIINGRW